MKENEHQIILTKMLNLHGNGMEIVDCVPWSEIYEAIGRLKERASQPPIEKYIPWNQTLPLQVNQPANPNLHYHGVMPCYQNPCTWC